MSVRNRFPNRLKFNMVYSDGSMIEGTVPCSDTEWNTMFGVLYPRKGEDAGIEAAIDAARLPGTNGSGVGDE